MRYFRRLPRFLQVMDIVSYLYLLITLALLAGMFFCQGIRVPTCVTASSPATGYHWVELLMP